MHRPMDGHLVTTLSRKLKRWEGVHKKLKSKNVSPKTVKVMKTIMGNPAMKNFQ